MLLMPLAIIVAASAAAPCLPMPPHILAIVSMIYVLGDGTKGTYSYVPRMAMGEFLLQTDLCCNRNG
jgi:hypothetical protein